MKPPTGNQKHGVMRRKHSGAAFTLIEMLVVIAIIAVLASMVLNAIPAVAEKREINRMRAELKGLEVAMEEYKNLYGSYPPDNNLPTTNTLYYELSGVELVTPGTVAPAYTYFSLLDSVPITAAVFTNIFKVEGAMNVTSKQANVKAKSFAQFKTPQFTRITNGAGVFTILTVASKNGVSGNSFTNQGRVVVPWQYVADRAVHNPGKYDLYVTIQINRKLVTIGNWKN